MSENNYCLSSAPPASYVRITELRQGHPLIRNQINVKDNQGGQSLIYIREKNEKKKEARVRGGRKDKASKASRKF